MICRELFLELESFNFKSKYFVVISAHKTRCNFILLQLTAYFVYSRLWDFYVIII